ncbi:MAG TPA: hypothetical protein VER55_12360, partial [Ardenticatenaceae bacterium]|nr:hypothetical protein [Ardenticatenaceae bacterium]
VVESEIGRQVTVTLDEVPDLHTVTVTLLIPTINLEGRESSFATVAILTTARTSIRGPGLVEGPVQSYQCVALKGTARQVDF